MNEILLDALRDIVSYTTLYGEAAGQRASKALEEYLDIGQGDLESIIAELISALEDAAERMERCGHARLFRVGGNWGMLDTEKQRTAIKKVKE